MSSPRLRIETDVLALWVLRLAPELARRDGVRVRFGSVPEGGPPPPGTLRIQRASLVGPAVTVLAPDVGGAAGARATAVRIGSSDVAWRGPNRIEPWLLRAGPLPALWSGRPDPTRKWALVGGGVSSHLDRIRALAAENDLQLHELVGRSRSRLPGIVRWAAGPKGVAGLLGKVAVVFAAPGPLAWDAERAGAVVVDPSPEGPERDSRHAWALQRLAHVVPYPLVHQSAFWSGLLADLRAGRTSAWGTDAWAARARDLADDAETTLPSLDRVQRKLRKLRRDPRGFLADARILRQLAPYRSRG